jgi:hypothetical protein
MHNASLPTGVPAKPMINILKQWAKVNDVPLNSTAESILRCYSLYAEKVKFLN